jgi:hypothetical protein
MEMSTMIGMAYRAMAQRYGDNEALMHQIISDERKQKLIELGYETASGLERLAIEAVALAWVRYTEVERECATARRVALLSKAGEMLEADLDAAQRRMLRAVETLIRARKLPAPAVQVNIAEKQFNQLNMQ